MTARMSRGRQTRRAGAPKSIEHVGPVEMRVTVAQKTPGAAKRWEQRVEVLAAWLAAEWQGKLILPRPRGRGRSEVLKLPATPGDEHDGR